MLKRYFQSVITLGVCLASLLAAHEVTAADKLSATAARLNTDISYLASDELQGRGFGTEGLNKAADYIKEQFAAAGLDVTRVNGGAFQTFSRPNGAELGSPNAVVLHGPDDQMIHLEIEKDYTVCSFGGSGKIEAPVVFVGYGIDNPDVQYDEYEGLDVKDKIVIIMRRTPRQGRKDTPFQGHHGGIPLDAGLRTKVSRAFGHGAAGILFVNDPYTGDSEQKNADQQIAKAKDQLVAAVEAALTADFSDESREKLAQASQRIKDLERIHADLKTDVLMKFGYGDTGKNNDPPTAHISIEACNKMLQSSLGKSLRELEAEIDSDMKPRSAELTGWTVSLETHVNPVRADVYNVIGVLEGEGPHADETIIVGAHYDHVGYGGPNSLAPGVHEIHNGADDNASGTVALLELARRFGSMETPPPRRMVFIAFTLEEEGLIGSAHYVKQPVFPLEKTIAMFNMDMVGRLNQDKLTVFGTGTSSRWKPLVTEEGEAVGFDLSLKPEGYGPSDHQSFYEKKIPVLHFFTGIHADYHRPTDDVERINLTGIERVVTMMESVIRKTLENAESPDYVVVKGRANINRSGSRPYFGSIPDFASEGQGYGISGVAPDSPADKGGLKGGDRIIQIGTIKINSLDDFDLALRSFSPGDAVDVVVLRNEKEVKTKVTLAHPR